MSASSEKKRRQAEREQGIDKRAQAQREAEEKAKKSNLKYRLAMIGIAVFVVLAIILNTALPFKMTAVKVNDTAYSAAEMNYFYANAYYENYQYMSVFGVNFGAPLENQSCVLMEDGGTWKDYLVESASESAKGLQAMYESAMAEGFELSEEGKANVEENMAYLAEYAEENGFKNTKDYLEAAYGTGVTEAIVRDLLTKGNISNEHADAKAESFTYSAADLEAYYKENIDSYQTYEYRYYLVAAETEEVTDAEGNTTKEVVEGGVEAAKTAADSIAAQITDEASFAAAVEAYKEGATVQTMYGAVKSSVNEAFRDWVTDADRAAGDVTTVSANNGAYVVMFVATDDNMYPGVGMRHILIKTVDADEDGVYSADEMAVAEAALKDIEAKWLAGEQTEEAFAALATEYSEDEGSVEIGGLYENIGKGGMVTEIDSFLFEEGRKVGDTTVVHGNNGYYDGYHLVYFVGESESYHLTLAEDTLRNEDFSAWYEEIMEGYTVTTGMGYNLIGK